MRVIAAVLIIVCASSAWMTVVATEVPDEWQQVWSSEYKRAYYYNALRQESTWDEPKDGLPLKKLPDIEDLKREAREAEAATRPQPSVVTVATSVLLPVLLGIVALYGMHWYVSTYHPEVFESSGKKDRDRAAKRKNKERASKFKQKWKMSQDGKGGRSANS